MRLSFQRQMQISAQLAALVGWRGVRIIGPHGYCGHAPRTSGGLEPVPNYFTSEDGKRELLNYISKQTGQSRFEILYALNRRLTPEPQTGTARAALDDLFIWLLASPADVALALAETANLLDDAASQAA